MARERRARASRSQLALGCRRVSFPCSEFTEDGTMLEGNQAALFAERQTGTLPGELGIEWQDVSNGHAA
eukprot:gene37248-60503_t